VSHARRTSRAEGQLAAGALVIVLASAVVYGRVLVEILVVARSVFGKLAPPIAVMMASSILVCVGLWRMHRNAEIESAPHGNPTELRSALVFGGLYALVLLAVATARHYLGDRGVYLAAGISGLTDMDAITLSTAGMSARGGLPPSVAWRAIVIACVANFVFKAGVVAMLGGGRLFRRIAVPFAIQIATGLALLVLWPEA
jgi:uncharacterized membrane protein (DUF4010 family)